MLLFFFYLYCDHRDLHSFPTRRSSDLATRSCSPACSSAFSAACASRAVTTSTSSTSASGIARSEEHTSELQSLRHLVCRLLLEKKNLNRTAAERGDGRGDALPQPEPTM